MTNYVWLLDNDIEFKEVCNCARCGFYIQSYVSAPMWEAHVKDGGPNFDLMRAFICDDCKRYIAGEINTDRATL